MKKLVVSFLAVVLSLTGTSELAFAVTGTSAKDKLLEQNTMSVLWFQKSGEAKALYFQGYNIGKLRLDESLKKEQKGKKPAIVLDIDETVLDNSPYHAWMIQTRNGNPLDWSEWFNRGEAKPLPGALDFLRYADSKGVAIFYISNRKEPQKAATIKNLQLVGAPQADAEHVLLQQEGELGKETRRKLVAKTHEILLLFGDNLNDFKDFDQLSAAERMNRVEQDRSDYGNKFILFPNPMYGDWEWAIYNYDFTKSADEFSKLRKDNLEGSTP